MDSLHLTYDEVTNKIPYRNLVIMQKDKQHEVFGEIEREITDSEMFNRKFDELE